MESQGSSDYLIDTLAKILTGDAKGAELGWRGLSDFLS